MADNDKIGFRDMIALAKSGWTPKDVNELIDRFDSMNQSPEGEEDETKEVESESKDVESESPDDATESGDNESTEEPKSSAEIIELKKKIAELEKKNSQQNIQTEQKSLDDMVDDIFKEYFN